MKFSNFLFPESNAPEKDYQIIQDALREAELCDQLGFEVAPEFQKKAVA